MFNNVLIYPYGNRMQLFEKLGGSKQRRINEIFRSKGEIYLSDSNQTIDAGKIIDIVEEALNLMRNDYLSIYKYCDDAIIYYDYNNPRIKTMQVNDAHEVFVSANFVYNNLKMDSELVLAVLMHEFFHIIYDHIKRGANYINAVGKEFNKQTIVDNNIAADIEVNQTLVNKKVLSKKRLITEMHGLFTNMENLDEEIIPAIETMESVLSHEKLMNYLRHHMDYPWPDVETSEDFKKGYIEIYNTISKIIKKYGKEKTKKILIKEKICDKNGVIINDASFTLKALKKILESNHFDIDTLFESKQADSGQEYKSFEDGLKQGFEDAISEFWYEDGNEGDEGDEGQGESQNDGGQGGGQGGNGNNSEKNRYGIKNDDLIPIDNNGKNKQGSSQGKDDNQNSDDNDGGGQGSDDQNSNDQNSNGGGGQGGNDQKGNDQKGNGGGSQGDEGDEGDEQNGNGGGSQGNQGDEQNGDKQKDSNGGGNQGDEGDEKKGDEQKGDGNGGDKQNGNDQNGNDQNGNGGENQKSGKQAGRGGSTPNRKNIDQYNNSKIEWDFGKNDFAAREETKDVFDKSKTYTKEEIQEINDIRKNHCEKNSKEHMRQKLEDFKKSLPKTDSILKTLKNIETNKKEYTDLWDKILENFLKVSKRMGEGSNIVTYDWRNKRKIALGMYGINAIKEKPEDPQDINVYVDVSGSMDEELLSIIMEALAIFMEKYDYSNLNVIPWADRAGEIHRVDDSIRKDILKNMAVLIDGDCGSGTEAYAMADAIAKICSDKKKKEKDDIHLIFTDGYINNVNSIEQIIKNAVFRETHKMNLANLAIKNTLFLIYDGPKDFDKNLRNSKCIYLNSKLIKSNHK